MNVSILWVGDAGIDNELAIFIRNHPKSNWFTFNAMIPGPIVAGNSVFILFVANDPQGISGVIAANLYYKENYRKILKNPFRLQINGAPMIRENHPESRDILSALLEAVIKFSTEKVEVVEFRNFPASPEEKNAFESAGFRYEPHLNLIKPLTTEEDAWYSLSKCRRRQIRKSLNFGTRISVAQNIGQVKQLYRILYDLYYHRIHKKLPVFRTFAELFYRSRTKGDCAIIVVLADETVIGGIICLTEDKQSLTEWYVCGLDHAWKEHYPSVMATWGGIRYACENGLPVFNFLGLGKPGVPYGVRDFKLRFGGVVADYGRFLYEITNFVQAKPPGRSS